MAKSEAQEELFTQIAALASSSELSQYGADGQAQILRNLALAYRYVAGGPQPGGTASD